MRGRCVFLIIVCTAIFTAAGEKPPIEAEVPFRLQDGFIWIRVIAKESSAPLNFILDSGAAVSTVNLDSASRLGLQGGERVSVKGVGSSTIGFWPQRLNARIESVLLPRNYLVVDLCALQAGCQCRIDGLIGADFFEGRIVQIDFESKKIRLLRSTQSIKGETITLRKRRGVWQVPLSVNDSALAWFRLDTGCASGLQWVVSGALPEPSASKVSVALTEMKLPVTETRATVGTASLTRLPTSIHRSEIFSGEAGLAGLELLSRFAAVTLDGKANRLILTPLPRVD